MKQLDFEKPLYELYEKIDQLKRLSDEEDIDMDAEISRIEKRAEKVRQEIYKDLTPPQIVQIARHPNRPDCLSLLRLMSDSFVPLHGDRQFRDDPSIVGGLAVIGGHKCVVIGHQKGHDTKENIYRNFGMPHPEGYRKALRLMHMAEKFRLPIVTFIDTPGAYPGLEAEERGQSEAIARNLKEMSALTVPIISFVIGEGGSGGALAIGVSNRVYMLQYSVYSVISPEGCASILFRDAKKSDEASKSLKITAENVVKLGIADGIVAEPFGGAHHDWTEVAENMKSKISKDLVEYRREKPSDIQEERYRKFRNIGQFVES
jgi:acetyl-CoA carboxylase carboxyl transferase subunit alpha